MSEQDETLLNDEDTEGHHRHGPLRDDDEELDAEGHYLKDDEDDGDDDTEGHHRTNPA